VVDLIRMKAVYFDGNKGEGLRLPKYRTSCGRRQGRPSEDDRIHADIDDAIAEKYLQSRSAPPRI